MERRRNGKGEGKWGPRTSILKGKERWKEDCEGDNEERRDKRRKVRGKIMKKGKKKGEGKTRRLRERGEGRRVKRQKGSV